MKEKSEKDNEVTGDSQIKVTKLNKSTCVDKTFKKNMSAKIIETKPNLIHPPKDKKIKKLNLNHSQVPIPKNTTERVKNNIPTNKADNQSLLKTLETITYINTANLNTNYDANDDVSSKNYINREIKTTEKDLFSSKLCPEGKKSSQKTFESMMERMKNYEVTKEKKLEQRKNEIQNKLDKSTTKAPRINESSKKVTSDTFFQRQEKFLKAREEKIRNLKQSKEEKKIQINPTKKLNRSMIENNINNQLKWENERKQKVLHRKEQEIIEESKYCTFRPQINNNLKYLNKSTTDRTNEVTLTVWNDDLKIDLSKSTRGTDFTLPKPLKKHDSCKLYRSLYPKENENLIIENLFNEKFKELTNKFN